MLTLLAFVPFMCSDPVDPVYTVDWSFVITDGQAEVRVIHEGITYGLFVAPGDTLRFEAPLYSDVEVGLYFDLSQHPGGHYVIASNAQGGPYPDRWFIRWSEGEVERETLLAQNQHVLIRPDVDDPFWLTFSHYSPGDIEFTEITIYVTFVNGKIRHVSLTNRFN